MSRLKSQQEWQTIVNDAEREVLKIQWNLTRPRKEWDAATLAGTIDHTLLKLDITEGQIDALCKEAIEFHFKVGTPVKNLHHHPMCNFLMPRWLTAPIDCVRAITMGFQSD